MPETFAKKAAKQTVDVAKIVAVVSAMAAAYYGVASPEKPKPQQPVTATDCECPPSPEAPADAGDFGKPEKGGDLKCDCGNEGCECVTAKAGCHCGPCTTKQVEVKEVIKYVPKEVVKEVIKYVPKEVVKEVIKYVEVPAKPKGFTGIVVYVDDVNALLNGKSSCVACIRFANDAVRAGYTVGSNPDADFVVKQIPDPSKGYPLFALFVDGKVTFTKRGYDGDFQSILKRKPK